MEDSSVYTRTHRETGYVIHRQEEARVHTRLQSDPRKGHPKLGEEPESTKQIGKVFTQLPRGDHLFHSSYRVLHKSCLLQTSGGGTQVRMLGQTVTDVHRIYEAGHIPNM